MAKLTIKKDYLIEIVLISGRTYKKASCVLGIISNSGSKQQQHNRSQHELSKFDKFVPKTRDSICQKSSGPEL